MSEYPEEIMKAAYEVTEKSIPAIIQPKDWDVIEEAIAAAILAERERCADIARNAQGPEEAYDAIMMGDV